MCFSAGASFSASAIILTIGVVSMKRSTTIPQRVLSCIPLIFGIQQFTEGILWLSMSQAWLSPWKMMATYAFLIFAQVVWPTMVPLSVLLLENDRRNKRVLKGSLALGIIISAYLAYCLIFFNVSSSVSCYHIQYDVDYPKLFRYSGLLYFIVTVIPPIISTIKRLRLLGAIICLSYVITKIFYEDYFVSVWCYFAAIISIVVLSVVIKLNADKVRAAP